MTDFENAITSTNTNRTDPNIDIIIAKINMTEPIL